MRLTRLQMRGFRAFGRETELNFAGDVVVLVGPNGSGKTSVFDAIEWSLFGVVPRLRGSRDSVGEDYIRNRFMPDVPSEVSLFLSSGDITAVVQRAGQSLVVVDENRTNLRGAKAEQWIGRHISPSRTVSSTSAVDVFERTNLLGQDRIVDFVRDTNPRDRFDSLSNLLGADIARRFYQYAERWAQNARVKQQEAVLAALQADRALEQMRIRRLDLEAEANAAPTAAADRIHDELIRLAEAAASLGLVTPKPTARPDLERDLGALRDLQAQGETQERRADGAIATIGSLEERAPDIELARRRTAALQADVAKSAAALASAAGTRTATEVRLATLRERMTALESSLALVRHDRREFAQFLTLAKRHVQGDHCPVCEQGIDEHVVTRRLQERIALLPAQETSLVEDGASVKAAIDSESQHLVDATSAEQTTAESARQSSRLLATVRRDIEEWEAASRDALAAWSAVSLPAATAAARARKASMAQMLDRVRDLIREATAASAKSTLVGLAPLELKARSDRKQAEGERNQLSETVDTLDRLVTNAKESEIDIVEAAINRQLPTLQAVYRRLNPHPLFDDLDVRFRELNDRGEVYYRAAQGATSGNASMMFSSAQMNAVAVSVFLALNLLRPNGGFGWLLLDDPIQNMDDYNILGLVDLLRSVRGSRQLVVSTHDDRLGELLQRKLRPGAAGQRTIVHRFDAADEYAPRVLTTSVEHSPEPYVLQALAG